MFFLLFIFSLLALVSCKDHKSDNNILPYKTADTIENPVGDVEEEKENPNPIQSIRKKVERINTIDLHKKHFEFMCDEKMMVDYFYEDNKIVKIAVDFGTVGDVYAKEGYYYNNGKLIFIYEFVEGGPACEGCWETNEYRSYIVNDKTIKYLKNTTEEKCKKCKFGNYSRHYKLLEAKTEKEVKAILCPQ